MPRFQSCIHVAVSLILVCITSGAVGSPFKGNGQSNKKYDVHQRMTREELEHYFGVSSHNDVPEYLITKPFKADEHGEFRSFDLKHDHKDVTKRAPHVHYGLKAFDETLHLKVKRDTSVLAHGLRVESHYADGTVTHGDELEDTTLTGHVTSYPESFVALSSNDDGLMGVIQHKREYYVMHPLPTHLAKQHDSGNGAVPHLLTQRSEKSLREQARVDAIRPYVRDTTTESSARDFSYSKRERHKFLEMAFVADKYVINYVKEQTHNYLLLNAHILRNIFRDPSIGNIKITIAIVKIALLPDGLGYENGATNGAKLKALETWALANLPHDDNKPQHPDVVALFTRGTGGGLALSSTICEKNPPFGLLVNDDLGLDAPLIIAHETAHVIGLDHDVLYNRKECPDSKNIMSSSTPGGNGAFFWSECSREIFQHFLKSTRSRCLDDVPVNAIKDPGNFYDHLPGTIVNGDDQCKLIEGEKHYQCPQRKSNCGSLYCTTDGNSCVSPIVPPADGTRCGDHHWCIRGQCVDDGSPVVDGEWSDWLPGYSNCSQPCGRGVMYKSRTCTNPSPKNGGEYCLESSKGHWKICNTQACPKDAVSFRDQQCQAFAPDLKAHFSSSKPCSLICARGSEAFPKGTVKDGTSCHLPNAEIKKVCIEGECRPIGCDDVLESGEKKDRCGECGGESSTCQFTQAVYTKDYRGWGIYSPDTIAVVPKGATNIYVKEKGADWSMIGVQNMKGQYLFNLPTFSTTVHAVGTIIKFVREGQFYAEEITIPGPITEPIKIVYVYYGSKNAGVDYKFFVPGKFKLSPAEVEWKTTEWSKCTETCGGGTHHRVVECVIKSDKSNVNLRLCALNSKEPPKEEACNTQVCPPAWFVSDWRSCSKTCGNGSQIREIICRQKVCLGTYKNLKEESCDKPKPEGITKRECAHYPCPPQWEHSKWSECSRTCAGGVKTSILKCMQLDERGHYLQVPNGMCLHDLKEPTKESCNEDIDCNEVVGTLPPTTVPGPKPYIQLGCYRDNKDRSLPEYLGTVDTVEECSDKAKENYDKIFALQNGEECWSGFTAEKSYKKHGKSDKCTYGMGGSWANNVYKLKVTPVAPFKHVGCFKDSRKRAMPKFLGYIGGVINLCYKMAKSQSYKVFGIQNIVECWSGPEADKTYNQLGRSNACSTALLGGPWANSVYRILK